MAKQKTAKNKFPTEAKFYKILEEIGRGRNSIFYRALCISMNTNVAIKAITLDESSKDFFSVLKDTISLSAKPKLIHQNILNTHCAFPANHGIKVIWVVMPFMSAGSLLSILSTSFPTGLSEECIADILLQTLNLMSYLHLFGIFFMDLKPRNIFLDLNNKAVIKFSDICYPLLPTNKFLEEIDENPYWVPPELYKTSDGLQEYTVTSDTWSLGILALELAQGKPPISNITLPTSLTKIMSNRLFSANSGECSYSDKRREFSRSFKDFVKKCLEQCPRNRPSLKTLRKHRFFKRCRSPGFHLHDLLKDLPGEKQRNKFTKTVEEEKKKVEVVKDEEETEDVKSQSKICGWELNVENLELFPTYSCDHHDHDHDPNVMGTEETQVEKRVRFGGEKLITDNEATTMDIDGEEEDEDEDEDEDEGIVNDMWEGICDPIQDIINTLEGMSREFDEVCESTSRKDVFFKLVLTRSNIEKLLCQLTFLIDMHGEALKMKIEIQMRSNGTTKKTLKPMKTSVS